jgi:hypothetical protein
LHEPVRFGTCRASRAVAHSPGRPATSTIDRRDDSPGSGSFPFQCCLLIRPAAGEHLHTVSRVVSAEVARSVAVPPAS